MPDQRGPLPPPRPGGGPGYYQPVQAAPEAARLRGTGPARPVPGAEFRMGRAAGVPGPAGDGPVSCLASAPRVHLQPAICGGGHHG
jgi:hypothetical protein